jgi:hypothetical protein
VRQRLPVLDILLHYPSHLVALSVSAHRFWPLHPKYNVRESERHYRLRCKFKSIAKGMSLPSSTSSGEKFVFVVAKARYAIATDCKQVDQSVWYANKTLSDLRIVSAKSAREFTADDRGK